VTAAATTHVSKTKQSATSAGNRRRLENRQ
jgi:hypothetical protein